MISKSFSVNIQTSNNSNKSFNSNIDLPLGLSKLTQDEDANGLPDFVDDQIAKAKKSGAEIDVTVNGQKIISQNSSNSNPQYQNIPADDIPIKPNSPQSSSPLFDNKILAIIGLLALVAYLFLKLN